MKHLSIKTSCFMALVALLFTACSKDPVRAPQQGPDEQSPVQELRLAPTDAYLPLAGVDSAIAIWTVNGTTKTVKLQAADGVWKMSLGHWEHRGTGTLTVQLFTQLKLNGQFLQWEYRTPYTLDHSKPVLLSAPTGLSDRQWNPRVVFHYDNSMGSRFSAVIALRPGDPYFELKGVAPIYAKKIEIIRSFHNKTTGQTVFSRGWVCEHGTGLDGTGSLVDRQHFLNLDELVEGRQWDEFRVEAYFHLNSTPASTYGFALVQDKLP